MEEIANNKKDSEIPEKKMSKKKWKDRDEPRCQKIKKTRTERKDNRQDKKIDPECLRQGFWTYTPLMAP